MVTSSSTRAFGSCCSSSPSSRRSVSRRIASTLLLGGWQLPGSWASRLVNVILGPIVLSVKTLFLTGVIFCGFDSRSLASVKTEFREDSRGRRLSRSVLNIVVTAIIEGSAPSFPIAGGSVAVVVQRPLSLGQREPALHERKRDCGRHQRRNEPHHL